MSQTTAPDEARAKDPGFDNEPRNQHRWLQKLLGEWNYTMDVPPSDGQTGGKAVGVERFRKVGELWVIGEAQGEMPGLGASTSIITLGFDHTKDRFVGTWIGTMMPSLWVYDGELDPSERVLTLHSVGPRMDGQPGTTKYQDIIEFKSDTQRTLTGKHLDARGQWQQMMLVEYTKK